MKPDKIRELTVADLKNKHRELQEQLFRLRFQRSTGQLDNAMRIRQTRRDIARIKTILRERARAKPTAAAEAR